MSSKVEIKKLNIKQTIAVYNNSLKKEFPVNERRPLVLIIKGMFTNTYECLGAFYKGRMLGYAFFLKRDDDYLWDYLAVLKKYRCRGVGSKIIKAVKEFYKDANSVIGEVENPVYADNSEESEIMKRRLNFYLRNGCIDTGVRTITFGAHFIIIKILGKKQSKATVAKLYQRYYRDSLPRRIYVGNIKIEKL